MTGEKVQANVEILDPKPPATKGAKSFLALITSYFRYQRLPGIAASMFGAKMTLNRNDLIGDWLILIPRCFDSSDQFGSMRWLGRESPCIRDQLAAEMTAYNIIVQCLRSKLTIAMLGSKQWDAGFSAMSALSAVFEMRESIVGIVTRARIFQGLLAVFDAPLKDAMQIVE